jgi:hypothetical protein
MVGEIREGTGDKGGGIEEKEIVEEMRKNEGQEVYDDKRDHSIRAFESLSSDDAINFWI